MPWDQIFVCVLVVVMTGLFIWEKIAPDIVALGVLLLLYVVPVMGADGKWKPVLGTGSSGQIFANNGLLTVLFMFVLGAAIERSGLVNRIGDWFEDLAGKGERKVMWVLAALACSTSAFLNNTTVVVVLLPVLLQMARRLQVAPSRWLIPLSYFAIAGGMCTLIGTSTNLTVNGIVAAKGMPGLPPFGMFDITPVGIGLAVVIVIYLLLGGRKLLVDRISLANLLETSEGKEFLTVAIVGETSPLVGKTWRDAQFPGKRMMRPIEVSRNGETLTTPIKSLVFEIGDRVILRTRIGSVAELHAGNGLEIVSRKMGQDLGLTYTAVEQAVMMEGMVGPRSRFIGKSVRSLNFRSSFGVLILAVHRHGENMQEKFEDMRFEVGDTLLIEGTETRIRELSNANDLLNLTSPPVPEVQGKFQKYATLVALLLVVVMGTFQIVPFEWVAMGAAMIVVISRCLSPDQAYQSVDWRIISMLLGTIALGFAMDKTGAARTIVEGMLGIMPGISPWLALSLLFLTAILFTELLSNNAVAALMTPLAIEMALAMHARPQAFVIAVMLGASIGFAIPAGYQTHMLVYGPGGYKFSDFLKAGIPLDLICWVTGSILIPLVFPF